MYLINLYYSEFNSNANPTIKFGRKKNTAAKVDVAFVEESTSRVQCTITYNPNTKVWKLVDSDGSKKPSLNGTWFLADEYTLIENKTLIRVGTTTFEASFVQAQS